MRREEISVVLTHMSYFYMGIKDKERTYGKDISTAWNIHVFWLILLRPRG